MTWSDAPEVVATIRSIMLDSREIFVHYTMPLGLHHLIGGDHYAPMPENADPRRGGLDRDLLSPRGRGRHRLRSDARGGSDAVDQYRAPLREWWNAPASTPDELLLWFHRLPWDCRMKSGRTLWDEMVLAYNAGRGRSEGTRDAMDRRCAGKIDEERTRPCSPGCAANRTDAAAWRDKCVRYFEAVRGRGGRRSPEPRDTSDET